jgi:hypothetical protein
MNAIMRWERSIGASLIAYTVMSLTRDYGNQRRSEEERRRLLSDYLKVLTEDLEVDDLDPILKGLTELL